MTIMIFFFLGGGLIVIVIVIDIIIIEVIVISNHYIFSYYCQYHNCYLSYYNYYLHFCYHYCWAYHYHCQPVTIIDIFFIITATNNYYCYYSLYLLSPQTQTKTIIILAWDAGKQSIFLCMLVCNSVIEFNSCRLLFM